MGPGESVRDGTTTRRAARNVVAVAAAEVAGKVATLAFTIAAVRALGKGGFGAFSYALSFSLIAGTLASWGFGAQLVQRGSEEPKKLPQFLSEVLVWRTAIAVPVFLAAGIGGLALRPETRSTAAFLMILAAALLDVYADAGRSVAGALQSQAGVSIALVVQRIATAILAIAVLVAGFGLTALAATYLIGTIVGTVGVFISVRRLGVKVEPRLAHRAGLIQSGRLSVAVGIDTVVAMLLFRVDQVLLGTLQGDRAVGGYAATYRLLETVLFLSWAVSRAVFPVISARSDVKRVRRGVEEGVAAVALLYVPFAVGLWMEAGGVLRTLYGHQFTDAVSIARWLAPAPLLFAVSFLGNYGLLARGRRWQTVVASLVAAAFNVALNLLLIPHLSGIGAAIATTASYGLESAIILGFLFPEIGLVRLDRALGVPIAASAVMAAALAVSPWGVAVEVPLGIVVYGLIWYGVARWRKPEHLAVLRSVLPRRS